MNIKAIQTSYKGYRFRSRTEARWAVFFDALGIAWEYEKEGYDLGELGWYLPDFWLPESQMWVEIKPSLDRDRRKVYLAGKIGKAGDWRERVGLCLRPNYSFDADIHLVMGTDFFQGPKWIEIDHNFDYGEAVRQGLAQIDQSDTVFAWLDSGDCHGTLVEIGYAKARGKKLFIGVDFAFEWQARELYGFAMACTSCVEYADNPETAYAHLVHGWCDEERRLRHLAITSESAGLLIFGVPQEKGIGCATLFASYRNNYGGVWGYPALISDGILNLFPPGLRSPHQFEREKAFQAARSARFEHGESPQIG